MYQAFGQKRMLTEPVRHKGIPSPFESKERPHDCPSPTPTFDPAADRAISVIFKYIK